MFVSKLSFITAFCEDILWFKVTFLFDSRLFFKRTGGKDPVAETDVLVVPACL